jgi:transposase-like protein
MPGQKRRSEAKESSWRRIVSGFDPARTTVREWCKEQGVSEPSFYSWRRELTQRAGESTSITGAQFVPVQIAAVAPPVAVPAVKGSVKIRLPSGLRLQVSLTQLAAVLDVLESRSC